MSEKNQELLLRAFVLIPLITARSSQRYLYSWSTSSAFWNWELVKPSAEEKKKWRNINFGNIHASILHKTLWLYLKLFPLQRCQMHSTMRIQITFCLSLFLFSFFFWSTPVPAIVCGSLPADTKSNTCSPN